MKCSLPVIVLLLGTFLSAGSFDIFNSAITSSRDGMKVDFKDDKLFDCVRTAAKRTSASLILKRDLKGVTKLSCKGEIKDISGIEQLSNLEELDLHGKEIEDIAPLAGLKKLRILNLYKNNIKDLSPVKNLGKLEYLDLSYNNIKNADMELFMELTNLDYLDLSFNKIEKADDLMKLKHIKYIVVSNNTVAPKRDVAVKEHKELRVR